MCVFNLMIHADDDDNSIIGNDHDSNSNNDQSVNTIINSYYIIYGSKEKRIEYHYIKRYTRAESGHVKLHLEMKIVMTVAISNYTYTYMTRWKENLSGIYEAPFFFNVPGLLASSVFVRITLPWMIS